MLRQGPLETHDGREGNRGVIVNICSSGGIASRPSCRACFLFILHFIRFAHLFLSPGEKDWLAFVQDVAVADKQELCRDKAAYAASRAAIISLTRADALDVSDP